jgi:hypothetical protein
VNLKQVQLTNNLTIKILSLILGYLIWATLSKQQFDTIEKSIPICFYNNENYFIETTEFIKARISGLRKDLFFNESNAVHIDAAFINEEKTYNFSIYPEHIFLRQGLNLISYKPSNITITVKKI